MDPRDELEEIRADAPPGLFLSRGGAWFHDGQRVGHARLEALLHRSIVRRDGALIVTTGRDVLPFVAEDAPLVVRRVIVEDQGQGRHAISLALSTGATVPLEGPLTMDPGGRLRAPVAALCCWAIFARSAAQALEPLLDDDGALHTTRGPLPITPVHGPPVGGWQGAPTS
jgi:hypothetical protein